MEWSFSTAQNLSLAGMIIGSMLCIVGLGAPYWLVIKGLVGGSVGLFMACRLQEFSEKDCRMIDMNSDIQWLYVTRFFGSVCVLVCGICGLVALRLACRGRGSRFVSLGVICFLAAAVGAVALHVFVHNKDVFTTTVMNVYVASYGWAFFLYCGGVGLLGLASIMACFSAPEYPIGGMVLGYPWPAAVIVTQTGAHLYTPSAGARSTGLKGTASQEHYWV